MSKVAAVIETIAEKKLESAIVRRRIEDGLIIILPNCPTEDMYIKSMATALEKNGLYEIMFTHIQQCWHNQFREMLNKEFDNSPKLIQLEEDILKLNTWLSQNV